MPYSKRGGRRHNLHDAAGAFMALCVWIEIGFCVGNRKCEGDGNTHIAGFLADHVYNGGTVRSAGRKPSVRRANRRGEENGGEAYH